MILIVVFILSSAVLAGLISRFLKLKIFATAALSATLVTTLFQIANSINLGYIDAFVIVASIVSFAISFTASILVAWLVKTFTNQG